MEFTFEYLDFLRKLLFFKLEKGYLPCGKRDKKYARTSLYGHISIPLTAHAMPLATVGFCFFAVSPESFCGSFPVSYTGTRNPRRDSGECGNTGNRFHIVAAVAPVPALIGLKAGAKIRHERGKSKCVCEEKFFVRQKERNGVVKIIPRCLDNSK